jgi:hypothetical protein
MSNDNIILTLANIKSHAERLKHAFYDAWKKENPDYNSKGGQITSPAALQGAKEAMNDKYGPGSVEW